MGQFSIVDKRCIFTTDRHWNRPHRVSPVSGRFVSTCAESLPTLTHDGPSLAGRGIRTLRRRNRMKQRFARLPPLAQAGILLVLAAPHVGVAKLGLTMAPVAAPQVTSPLAVQTFAAN